jgi:acyl-CoA thioesterase I
VIVEIGGNDLLGPTSAEQFERDLDRLLRMLQPEDREIVMLELPLPPTYNRIGRIQRRLAADYNVRLIHRRHFARVFLHSGGTLDGLHLSNSGHASMARMIGEQLRLERPSPN